MHVPSDPFADHPLPREPLVHCRLCGSRLIYPVGAERTGESLAIRCRCPECWSSEVVVTSPLVAAVWRRREARAAAAMHRVADELAELR